MTIIHGTPNSDILDGTIGDDFILAAKGNDILNGKEGSDYLYGKMGGDKISGGVGDDLLKGGRGQDFLWGETGNDSLVGGRGSDDLVGGAGNDTLTGGVGIDAFWFDAPDEGIDTITDFQSTEDILIVDKDAFSLENSSTSLLKAEQFVIGSQATSSASRFIYNSTTGDFFFDSDGSGSASQVLLAQLAPSTVLSAGNIVVAVM